MANLFSLFGIVSIDGVAQVKKDISSVNREILKSQRHLVKFSKSLERTGENLTKALTLPILAAGTAITKFGADFENAMTGSLAIMGNVSDAMRKDMEQTARDVAKTTVHSATDAANAYYYLASAGLDAGKSIKALPQVAAFAQAGTFDLALATDLLTDAQSALGLSSTNTAKHMQNMARVSDVLVKANTVSNASVRQFSESLTNKAGAALRLLNKDMEEGLAVLAVFADQGLKGAAAGEALNIVLRDLQTASIKNREAFKNANIQVFDSNKNMNNLGDIVAQLEDRFSGLSDEQKRTELMMLGFKDKSVSATMALLGTSDAIKAYESRMYDALGITDEVAKKQLNSLISQLKILRNRLVDVALELSKSLLPILKESVVPWIEKLSEKLSGLADWFNDLSPAMRKTIVGWTVLLATVGPVTVLLGKMVLVGKVLIPALFLMAKGQLALNVAMRANPVGLVVTALLALGAASIYVYNNWDKFRKYFLTFWYSMKDMLKNTPFQPVITALTGIVKAGIYLLNNWKTLGLEIKLIWRGIVFNISQSASLVKIQFLKITAGFTGMIANMAKNVPIIGKTFKDMSKGYKDLENNEIRLRNERKIAHLEQMFAAKARIKEIQAIKSAKSKAKDEDTKKTEKTDNTVEKEKEKTKTILEETEKQRDEAKKLADDRARFEKDWTRKYLDESQTRIEILKRERAAALEEAERLGADNLAVKNYYSAKILEAHQAYYDEQAELDAEEADRKAEEEQKAWDKQLEKFNFMREGFQAAIGLMSSISDAFYSQSMKNIEKRKQKEIAAIKASKRSDEDKTKMINAVEEKFAAKAMERKRKAAIAEKAYALFQIGLNTAMAIMNVLATAKTVSGRIAQIALVTATSLAQTIAVASKSIPLAMGAFIKGRRGGVTAEIGEGREDEIVFPVEKGLQYLVDKLAPKLIMPGEETAPVMTAAQEPSDSVTYNLHVGTLVADPSGLRELEKQMRRYRFEEDQRRGE